MVKRAQLVSQHLENISSDALEKYQDIVRQYVRGRQGVYGLYRHGRLYYVGLASNLRSRLKRHLRDRHGQSWDRFSVYLTIGDSHLKELESLLLRMIKPTGNKISGKFVKSEDLRRRFSRDIRMLQRRELTSIIGRSLTNEIERKQSGSSDRRRLVLSRHITRPMLLRARFKGKLLKARARRDGSIRFAGKIYASPSMAAAAACRRRTCNGWTFWTFERAPGDWVRLDELRK
jgi:hypothetical protein